MTLTSTPSPQGPSAQTLDFVRSFARTYQPAKPYERAIVIHYYDRRATLGDC